MNNEKLINPLVFKNNSKLQLKWIYGFFFIALNQQKII